VNSSELVVADMNLLRIFNTETWKYKKLELEVHNILYFCQNNSTSFLYVDSEGHIY
jgi:hypothetical protein